MTLTVREYDSTDGSARSMVGNTAGVLGLLLRDILVTGYGSKTAAGWTEPFTAASNVYVFKQGTGGSNRYLWVKDDGSPATLTTRAAIVRGYESMSALNTGVDPFPTVALVADTASLWVKSNTNDGTVRAWHAYATEAWIILTINLNGSSSFDTYIFGDMESAKASDPYKTFINVRNNATSSSSEVAFTQVASSATAAYNGQTTYYWCRSSDGTVKSPRGAFIRPGTNLGITEVTGASSAPDEFGNINSNPIELFDAYSNTGTAGTYAGHRGWLPATLQPRHGLTYTGIAHRDTFFDTSNYSGIEFRIFNLTGGALSVAASPRIIHQTSGSQIVVAT